MAFLKTYTDPNIQARGDYWDIFAMSIDPIANKTSFVLGCFISSEAKESGAEPLTAINFNDNEGELSKDQCQSIVLERSEFSDAVIL
jgi:hypothetical protein